MKMSGDAIHFEIPIIRPPAVKEGYRVAVTFHGVISCTFARHAFASTFFALCPGSFWSKGKTF